MIKTVKNKRKYWIALCLIIGIVSCTVVFGLKVSSTLNCDKNNLEYADGIAAADGSETKNKLDIGNGNDVLTTNIKKMLTNPGGTDSKIASMPDREVTDIDVYKPNIYIYANSPLTVNVQLYPYEYITESDPVYDGKFGWRVNISDGSINGSNDYLFYEARVPIDSFQKQEAFMVQGSVIEKDMIAILNVYNFSKIEIDDFIDYWTQCLGDHKDWLFYPQNKNIVDRIMSLKIVPSIYESNCFRLWFYIEEFCGQEYQEVEIVEPIKREDYYLVEWGGIMK